MDPDKKPKIYTEVISDIANNQFYMYYIIDEDGDKRCVKCVPIALNNDVNTIKTSIYFDN